MTDPDVTVRNEGTLFLFALHTDAAREWVEENVSDERTEWEGALVVQARFAPALADGMTAAGLVLE